MANRKIVLILSVIIMLIWGCNKGDNNSETFNLLTDHAWVSDSLLLNGLDASSPGSMLEKFKGDAQFYEDGSGYFGQYEGGWYFTNNESDITITSDSLQLPLTSNIIELTDQSFKITTQFPAGPLLLDVRITFKAK